MPPRVTDEHLSFARKLRAQMSVAETMLWRSLRNRGIQAKFRRQVPIGPYVADFASVAGRLVVELDGAPHDAPGRQGQDKERDLWLAQHGWRVVRFRNEFVLGGGDLVLNEIKRALSESPHPTSLREATFSRGAGEGTARIPDEHA